ncbi:MAG: hypothetical protein Q9160_006406 [Pyrenula sp. 1 TL-2023]
MFGFSLARLQYLNVSGTAKSSFANGASPGEWYWYRTGIYRIGITLHLATILPAGLLMIWQFIPVIRHKFLLFHRLNGYAIILLTLLSNIGVLMIVRRSFGGTIETQTATGVLVILTTTSLCLAYYNIKRLQIDQHRAWMLRAMFYLGTIITLRLIMLLSALIITRTGPYYTTRTCAEISFMHRDDSSSSSSSSTAPNLTALYPQCTSPNTTSSETHIPIPASFPSPNVEEIGASLGLSFGMAMWLATLIHLIGVEVYLGLTPREGNRLRQVSYERQMERGMKDPGNAGLTSWRVGDAERWEPAMAAVGEVKVEEKAKGKGMSNGGR